MKRYVILIGCLFIFLTACGSGKKPVPTPSPSPTVADISDIPHQEPVQTPEGEYENPFPPIEGKETVFTLNETQQALFDKYSKDYNFDISVFKGAAPMDVAHVYIECGIEGLWEGEYNLFYFESARLSKASFKAENDQDLATRDIRSRRDYANILLGTLKDGEFVDTGDESGYIRFETYENTSDYESLVAVKSRMYFKKVDGIWMIDQNRMFVTE